MKENNLTQEELETLVFNKNTEHHIRILKTYQMDNMTKLRTLTTSSSVHFDIKKAAIRRMGWIVLNNQAPDCSLVHTAFMLKDTSLLIDTIMFIESLDGLKRLELKFSKKNEKYLKVKQAISMKIADMEAIKNLYNPLSVNHEKNFVARLNFSISALKIFMLSQNDEVKKHIISVLDEIFYKTDFFNKKYIEEFINEISTRCLSWEIRALNIINHSAYAVNRALEDENEEADLKLYLLENTNVNQDVLHKSAINDNSLMVRLNASKKLEKKDAYISVIDNQPSLMSKIILRILLLTHSF